MVLCVSESVGYIHSLTPLVCGACSSPPTTIYSIYLSTYVVLYSINGPFTDNVFTPLTYYLFGVHNAPPPLLTIFICGH